MTSRGDRSALARYVDLLAGKGTPHTEIAARINEKNPGAKVAGTLVSRWRSQQLDVSAGNLAALARAYDRSPLEAFVVAGLLEVEEAAPGLDSESRAVLDIVWNPDVEIVFALGEEPDQPADELEQRRADRKAPPAPQKRAARKKTSKPKLGDQ